MSRLNDIAAAGKVIPVLSYKNSEEAVATSRTLYSAGIRVFEITLRHETALDAIRAVVADLPGDAFVGAGTVMTPALVDAAIDAGACFGVSPGLTATLAGYVQQKTCVKQKKWGFLPGIASLSEAMTAAEQGFDMLKFFPAEASGGVSFLKAAGSVLPAVHFCPTGGLTPARAPDYLALANVPVVGGSWLVVREADGSVDQQATYTAAAAAAKIQAA